jgi:hypothetical protein
MGTKFAKIYTKDWLNIQKASHALVFCRNADLLADCIEFNCQKIMAKAVHEPMP